MIDRPGWCYLSSVFFPFSNSEHGYCKDTLANLTSLAHTHKQVGRFTDTVAMAYRHRLTNARLVVIGQDA